MARQQHSGTLSGSFGCGEPRGAPFTHPHLSSYSQAQGASSRPSPGSAAGEPGALSCTCGFSAPRVTVSVESPSGCP